MKLLALRAGRKVRSLVDATFHRKFAQVSLSEDTYYISWWTKLNGQIEQKAINATRSSHSRMRPLSTSARSHRVSREVPTSRSLQICQIFKKQVCQRNNQCCKRTCWLFHIDWSTTLKTSRMPSKEFFLSKIGSNIFSRASATRNWNTLRVPPSVNKTSHTRTCK